MYTREYMADLNYCRRYLEELLEIRSRAIGEIMQLDENIDMLRDHIDRLVPLLRIVDDSYAEYVVENGLHKPKEEEAALIMGSHTWK